MNNFANVLQQLRAEHKQVQTAVENLEKAISAIEGLSGSGAGVTANGTRPKRTMSGAARRKIAEAQRARWAKLRKAAQPPAKAHVVASKKRRLSPEGRRRIIAATKARWARVRAHQAKKAA